MSSISSSYFNAHGLASVDNSFSSGFFKFVFVLGCVMVFVWVIKLVLRCRFIYELAMSVRTNAIIYLDGGFRGFANVSRANLYQLLRDRIVHLRYEIEECRIHSHIPTQFPFKLLGIGQNDVEFIVPLENIHTSSRIFAYVGVSHSTIQSLERDANSFVGRKIQKGKKTKRNSNNHVEKGNAVSASLSHSSSPASPSFSPSPSSYTSTSPSLLPPTPIFADNEYSSCLPISPLPLGVRCPLVLRIPKDKIMKILKDSTVYPLVITAETISPNGNILVEITLVDSNISPISSSSNPSKSPSPSSSAEFKMDVRYALPGYSFVCPLDTEILPRCLKWKWGTQMLLSLPSGDEIRIMEMEELFGMKSGGGKGYQKETNNVVGDGNDQMDTTDVAEGNNNMPSSSPLLSLSSSSVSSSSSFTSALSLPPTDADTEATECIICFTNPKEIILLPCRHVCLCVECHMKSHAKCPVCRSLSDSFLRFTPISELNQMEFIRAKNSKFHKKSKNANGDGEQREMMGMGGKDEMKNQS